MWVLINKNQKILFYLMKNNIIVFFNNIKKILFSYNKYKKMSFFNIKRNSCKFLMKNKLQYNKII